MGSWPPMRSCHRWAAAPSSSWWTTPWIARKLSTTARAAVDINSGTNALGCRSRVASRIRTQFGGLISYTKNFVMSSYGHCPEASIFCSECLTGRSALESVYRLSREDAQAGHHDHQCEGECPPERFSPGG